MSSVAVIADIHGNPFALEAVIEDINAVGVDEVIVAGDLVGRGPFGSVVVDRISGLGWTCIRGNHEDYLLGFHRREVPDTWWETDEWAASRWMASELKARHYSFIDALPFSTTSTATPRLRVVHGSPESHSEGLGSWTKDEKIDHHLKSIEESILVCAHTHRPMVRHRPQGSVVNIGSTGLPFNGDWRAQYAIFYQGPRRAGHADELKGWAVELRQVEYDRDAFLEAYRSSGFLENGGVSAALLMAEVKTARPHRVPFLVWARTLKIAPTPEKLEDFFDLYDPSLPMSAFIEQTRALISTH